MTTFEKHFQSLIIFVKIGLLLQSKYVFLLWMQYHNGVKLAAAHFSELHHSKVNLIAQK